MIGRITMEKYKELLTEYDIALRLLDEYDHQSLTLKHSAKSVKTLDYAEAKEFISYMRFNKDSDVFGLEKEEGKLNGLPLNRAITSDGKIIDVIAGKAFICDCSEDELQSLSPEMMDKYLDMFRDSEQFLIYNGEIICI